MDPAFLVQRCIEVIDSFNPLRVTAETQLDNFCIERRLDNDVKAFLEQIFYASERYAKVLKIILDGLYDKCRTTANRSDYTMYRVMSILAVFKLQEIGIPTFRKFVLSQDYLAMKNLLDFFWDPEHLDGGYLESQWSIVYDIKYVQQKMIGTLQQFTSEIKELLVEINAVVGPTTEKDSIAAPPPKTESIPFKLSTGNRKKERPITPVLKFEYHANPVPASLRLSSLENVERLKVERREEHKKTNCKQVLRGPWQV